MRDLCKNIRAEFLALPEAPLPLQTDKTMTELEIDMNQRIGEWELIQESSVPLKPLFGPGYTGIRNLGNSCYLNSVVQVLFSIPDFQRK